MRRRRHTGWISAALLTVAAPSVLAWAPLPADAAPTAPPPSLMRDQPATLADAPPVAATGKGSKIKVLAQRRVALDLGLLPRGTPRRIRLNLFDNVAFDADLAPSPGGAPGWDNWQGRVVGVADSSVTLMRRGADVTALIVSPRGTYRIKNVGSGRHVAQHIGPGTSEGQDALVPPAPALSADAAPSAPQGLADSAPGPHSDLAGRPVIDVLVAYTPAALAVAGSVAAIESEAALAVSVTNTAYTASGVTGSLRLAGTMRTSANILPDSAGLNRLTSTNDGVIDEVHARRDALGADLVDVITGDPPATGSCGIAWLLTSLTVSQAPSSFSVTAFSCAVDNLSFPHEIGHNLGLAHDRYVSAPNPLFAHGYGYVNVPGRWRTVMAYDSKCTAAATTCTRLPRFSNPTQTYAGAALGRPVGAADAADNRAVLNSTMATVAGSRSVNPLTGFVYQQYADFMGRPPTPAEATQHVAILAGATLTRAGLVADLAHSPTFGGVYSPVARLYLAYFLRAPDLGGLDYWVGRHRSGTSLGVISGAFAGSREFTTRYGTLTNQAFVEQVYLNVLGRSGDSGGIAYWTGQLQTRSRGTAMIGFSESTEYKRVRTEEIDTILIYRGLLQRTPTEAEFASTVQRLESGATLTTIIDEILVTPVYTARIGY